MKTRRRATEDTPELLTAEGRARGARPSGTRPSGPATSGGGPERVAEYTPLGSREAWRVERWPELAVEFGLREADLVGFHELGLQHARGWLMVRRLFGLMPLIPPMNSDPDDLRAWSRAELCAALGLKPEELRAELDGLRAMWAAQVARTERSQEGLAELAPPGGGAAQGRLAELAPPGGGDFGRGLAELAPPGIRFDDDVLGEFGFTDNMFEVVSYNPHTKVEETRSSEQNRVEKAWFARRVKEFAKMLADPVGGALAREALMNELYLRRFGEEMTKLGPTNPRWERLYQGKKQIEQIYQEQIGELQGMFPEMGIAGRVTFRGCMADLIKAHRDYYARGDRQLIDRIFTSTEVEVLIRESVQTGPRYRFGLNMAIVEAMHGLHDPNWRPQFKPNVLKKLDAGFREAVKAMREALGEPVPDLEKGVLPGEGEEYEDLKSPKDL